MAQRVLVFESDEQLAQEVREGLEALGAAVDVVDNGPAGLELAEQQKPDLILLTIELPGMNGFLVCKKIKKHSELQSVPLIVLSSEATEETFEQHRKLRTRADDYLHKPVPFEELLRHVQRFVDLSGPARGAEETENVEDEPMDVEEAEPVSEGQAAGFDAEVEAFADSAFDALVMEEDEDEPTRLAPRDRISSEPAPAAASSGSEPAASAPSSVPPPLPSSRPPQPAPSSTPPARSSAPPAPASTPPVEEPAAAEPPARSGRASPSQSGRTVSNREYLQLREQLNKKEREILDLKDQIAQRDKQLLEARDSALGFEREAADAQDRLFEVEQELSQANERLQSVDDESSASARRAAELEQRVRELENEVQAHASAAEQQRERFDEELQQRLTQAEQSHQAALEALRNELEDKHTDAITRLKRDFEEREQAVQGIEEERDGLREELARVKSEVEGAVEARDRATGELSNVRHRVAELETRIERTRTKMQHDEQLLERARKAMAIGLSLLEDQQQNQLDVEDGASPRPSASPEAST